MTGQQVTLDQTSALKLSEIERVTLQKVALAKLQALNLGVEVKIPRGKFSFFLFLFTFYRKIEKKEI